MQDKQIKFWIGLKTIGTISIKCLWIFIELLIFETSKMKTITCLGCIFLRRVSLSIQRLCIFYGVWRKGCFSLCPIRDYPIKMVPQFLNEFLISSKKVAIVSLNTQLTVARTGFHDIV